MSDNTEPVVTNEQAITFIEAIGCHGDDWISEADLIAKELTAIAAAAVAKRDAEITEEMVAASRELAAWLADEGAGNQSELQSEVLEILKRKIQTGWGA